MNLTLDFYAAISRNLILYQSLKVNKRKSISDKSQYVIYAFRDLFVCFFLFSYTFFLCSNIGKCFGITLLSFYCFLGASFRFWKPCVCVYIISYLIQDNICAWIQIYISTFQIGYRSEKFEFYPFLRFKLV